MILPQTESADFIVRLSQVPGFERAYLLGSFSQRVTFSDQQTRAFNLIWALFERGRLKPLDRVVVVGAGLAGLTAAAAALSKSCRVTLVERYPHRMQLQR